MRFDGLVVLLILLAPSFYLVAIYSDVRNVEYDLQFRQAQLLFQRDHYLIKHPSILEHNE